MADIDTSVDRGTGRILLNRPHAINALSVAMVGALTDVLLRWIDDDAVREVVIEGAGRGFCAGADVRQLRQMVLDDAYPADFLDREYRLDYLIATYPKPYTARMHGIVMGGGMGLAIHAARRLVTADASLAMPETGIGLWPDVGMTYHLSRLPGQLGTYLALSGLPITGAQAVAVGLADALLDSDSLRPPAKVVPDDTWMADGFAGDDPAAILARLAASDVPEARQAAHVIRTRSPLSVAISLEAVRRAAAMTLEETFAQDRRLGTFFVGLPDFVEGVRAQLVDKDRRPRWSYARIEDVPRELVLSAFEPRGVPAP